MGAREWKMWWSSRPILFSLGGRGRQAVWGGRTESPSKRRR